MIALFRSAADAAVVHLIDGSTIRGTIVSATSRNIQIQREDLLVVEVDANRVTHIDYRETGPGAPPASVEYPASGVPFNDARAALYNEPNLFSFNLGIAAPLSDVDFSSIGGGSGENGDAGILIGTQYFYYTRPKLGLGFDIEFFNRGSHVSSSLLPAANTAVSGQSLLLMPVMRYSFTDRGRARPYFLAGLGVNRTGTKVVAAPQSGFVWSDTDTDETRQLIDKNKWGLASTARLGIDFLLMEPSMFSLELGWVGIFNGRYGATQAGRDLGVTSVTGDLHAMTLSGRWSWRF